MATIEKNWEEVAMALRLSIQLVANFGYNSQNLIATNAIIPIAYYIYKNHIGEKILKSSSRESDRKSIMEWLARVLLRGTFGGTPDAIYPVMRNLINQNPNRFPLPEIIEYYRGKRKTISFSEDDIDRILDLQYGKKRTYSALTLLYSSLNFSFKYHQDHIHPKSFFNKRKLSGLGVQDDKVKQQFIERCNKLPNLQLLPSTSNIEKNDKPFEEWLHGHYPNETDKGHFLIQNHIRSDISLKFQDFIAFYEDRRSTMKEKLMSILNVKAGEELIIEKQEA